MARLGEWLWALTGAALGGTAAASGALLVLRLIRFADLFHLNVFAGLAWAGLIGGVGLTLGAAGGACAGLALARHGLRGPEI